MLSTLGFRASQKVSVKTRLAEALVAVGLWVICSPVGYAAQCAGATLLYDEAVSPDFSDETAPYDFGALGAGTYSIRGKLCFAGGCGAPDPGDAFCFQVISGAQITSGIITISNVVGTGSLTRIRSAAADCVGTSTVENLPVPLGVGSHALTVVPIAGGSTHYVAGMFFDFSVVAGDTYEYEWCFQITGASVDFCTGDGGNQQGCTECPCNNNAPVGSGRGCVNSSGMGTRLLVSGSPSVSLPVGATTDLRFAASGAPSGALCILNSGDQLAPQGPNNPCLGLGTGVQSATLDGLRCAVGNTRRHGGRSADVNGVVGLTTPPWGGEGAPPAGIALAGVGFVAGQTRYFQIIHRDDPLALCQRGLNTSQAVRVTFTP